MVDPGFHGAAPAAAAGSTAVASATTTSVTNITNITNDRFITNRFFGGPVFGFGFGFGFCCGPFWWDPFWWPPAYPVYAYAPPVVIQPEPQVYVQPSPPSTPSYWYYCADAKAYYPYAQECPGGWLQVVPTPG